MSGGTQGARVGLTQQTLKARQRGTGRPQVSNAFELALFFARQEQRVRRVTQGHLERFERRRDTILRRAVANSSEWRGDMHLTIRGQVGSDAHEAREK